MNVKIGLISDTHGYWDEAILENLKPCDEVWHAGDWGSIHVVTRIRNTAPVKGVFGNIDGPEIRREFPEVQVFSSGGLNVLMTHIGGYPGKYAPGISDLLDEHRPQLFICGHSHILKVMRDKKKGLLHINPGAAGNEGFHKMRTLMIMEAENGTIKDLKVIELGKRGALK